MRKKVIVIVTTIAALVVTALVVLNEYNRSVVINDVGVWVEEDARYRIIAVDGELPNRRDSWIITMVPYVITSPGRHVVTVEKIVYDDTKTITSTIQVDNEFDSHSKYDLAVMDGELGFVRSR